MDIQFPLGKELVKSRMETGNRRLFPVYGCKTRREVKNKYRAVGFSENCSLGLDFIHI